MNLKELAAHVAADYKTKTGIEAAVFVTRPAAAATIIKA